VIRLKKVPLTIKKSLQYAFDVIAGVSTILGLWGYTLKDINNEWQWWKCGLIIFVSFIILSIIIFIILNSLKHKAYNTTVNGIPIKIKVGDIFNEVGLKVIPFNERFDTEVDDVIIAHNSLNGKMIDNYIKDINDLKCKIQLARTDNSSLKPMRKNEKEVYPLGRIIAYNDFLLLAFSHFDEQNNAYIGIGEYEQLLIRMWTEIRRTYAARQIIIPLLGGGITTIEGIQNKNYTELLKCILCTLRSSKFQPKQGITIVLTQEAIEDIDMNEIKEEF
jgi:hypothetical protein